MEGVKCVSGVPRTPLERPSTLLNADWMYAGSIVRFKAATLEEILRMHSLHKGFHEQPFQKDAITDVLSQLTLMQTSCKLLWVSHMTTSSIAMALAQPMSRLSESQPFSSRHAAQCKYTSTPMPTEVDASTQISSARGGRGTREQVPWG